MTMPRAMAAPSSPSLPYVHLLELSGRGCRGQTRATRVSVDLTRVLADPKALRAMVRDLSQPFASSRLDMVMALHIESIPNDPRGDDDGAAEGEYAAARPHRFTGAIAGAVAAATQVAYGEVTVFRAGAVAMPAKKKRGRPPRAKPSPTKPTEQQQQQLQQLQQQQQQPLGQPPHTACRRVLSFASGAHAGLGVEFKRDAFTAPGTRILLVIDWLATAESVLAARAALAQYGGDVIGVSCVVATSTQVVDALKKEQVLFSCAWTPPAGAQLTLRKHDLGGHRDEQATRVRGNMAMCTCAQDAEYSPRKRTRLHDVVASGAGDGDGGDAACQDGSRILAIQEARSTNKKIVETQEIELRQFTAQYAGNAPSEDRSVNVLQRSDAGVQIFAVFDGHGGSVAVDHVSDTLCERILSRISTQSSQDEIVSILKSEFMACDAELKRNLMSLSPTVRMSKGFCNTGACAVVAVFIQSSLYIANVGDCGAILGRKNLVSGSIVARELSVEHSCKNSSEARLVQVRSRDRHAIRLSKDEQASANAILHENGGSASGGWFGVKRVAGSLAVTRAFGDFYLKCEELSSAPFKSKVPYITVEPSISVHNVGDAVKQYLILASDGLWEVLTPAEAIGIVERFDPEQSLFFSSCSAALVHAALEKVAHRDAMMLHELLALPAGSERRQYHDDITCTVIEILNTHANSSRSTDSSGNNSITAESHRERMNASTDMVDVSDPSSP